MMADSTGECEQDQLATGPRLPEGSNESRHVIRYIATTVAEYLVTLRRDLSRVLVHGVAPVPRC
jgi:hypothetical protein